MSGWSCRATPVEKQKSGAEEDPRSSQSGPQKTGKGDQVVHLLCSVFRKWEDHRGTFRNGHQSWWERVGLGGPVYRLPGMIVDELASPEVRTGGRSVRDPRSSRLWMLAQSENLSRSVGRSRLVRSVSGRNDLLYSARLNLAQVVVVRA
jgi:hypothetical protein